MYCSAARFLVCTVGWRDWGCWKLRVESQAQARWRHPSPHLVDHGEVVAALQDFWCVLSAGEIGLLETSRGKLGAG